MILAELLLQTGDVEADRHTVHVAGAGAGHGVDVGVRVNPEHHRVLPPTRLILFSSNTTSPWNPDNFPQNNPTPVENSLVRFLTVVQAGCHSAQTNTVVPTQTECQPVLLQDLHHLHITGLLNTCYGNKIRKII